MNVNYVSSQKRFAMLINSRMEYRTYRQYYEVSHYIIFDFFGKCCSHYFYVTWNPERQMLAMVPTNEDFTEEYSEFSCWFTTKNIETIFEILNIEVRE